MLAPPAILRAIAPLGLFTIGHLPQALAANTTPAQVSLAWEISAAFLSFPLLSHVPPRLSVAVLHQQLRLVAPNRHSHPALQAFKATKRSRISFVV